MSEPTGCRKTGKREPDSMLPALAVLFASVLVLTAATLLPRDDARQVAAVFSPFATTQEISSAIAGTGARFVRPGAADAIMVVDLGAAASPAALYRAGAWLVIDAIAAGGCAVSGASNTTANWTRRSAT